MISTSICTIVQFTMCYIVYCIISLVYISADTMCTLAQTQAEEEEEEEEDKDKDTKRKIGTARKTKEPAFPLSSAASPLLYSPLLYLEQQEEEEEDKDTKRKIGTARKTKEPAFPLSSAASPLLYSTLTLL